MAFLTSVQARLLIPSLPDTIRVLDIAFEVSTEKCAHYNLGTLLTQMRQLVELRLLTDDGIHSGERQLSMLDITDSEGEIPQLPQLRKLHLFAKNWTSLVPEIASTAPLLHEVSTVRRIGDHQRQWPMFEVPPKEFWFCTIRHLRLMEKHTATEFFEAARSVEGWLPCLESLCCASARVSRPLAKDSG